MRGWIPSAMRRSGSPPPNGHIKNANETSCDIRLKYDGLLTAPRPRRRRFTRRAAEGTERAAERRTCVRKQGVCVPFRRSQDAPRSRYPPASRQVALFRPYRDPRPRFPGRATVGEDEPIQAKTHPFASNHADGGRVWPATRSPDCPSIPLGPPPLDRPPPPQSVAGQRALSPRRGGVIMGAVSTPGMGRRVKVTRR